MIKFDFKSYTDINNNLINAYNDKIKKISKILKNKESMLDWYDFDTTISDLELSNIKKYAQYIRKKFDLIYFFKRLLLEVVPTEEFVPSMADIKGLGKCQDLPRKFMGVALNHADHGC